MNTSTIATIIRADAPAPARLRLLELGLEHPEFDGSVQDLADSFNWSTAAAADVLKVGVDLGLIRKGGALTPAGKPCVHYTARLALSGEAIVAAKVGLSENTAPAPLPQRQVDARALADAGIPDTVGA